MNKDSDEYISAWNETQSNYKILKQIVLLSLCTLALVIFIFHIGLNKIVRSAALSGNLLKLTFIDCQQFTIFLVSILMFSFLIRLILLVRPFGSDNSNYVPKAEM